MLPVAACAASFGYLIFTLQRVVLFRTNRDSGPRFTPPVTILKPICGLDPEMLGALRSFCEQDYPAAHQVIFSVRRADDPAIPLIRKLIAEDSTRDIALVVDDRVFGPNLKVSALQNALGVAKHDIFVIADSDMRVERDYLRRVVGEFRDPSVGAVTCLYRGSADGNISSQLGAMFINDWFLPSVLVALAVEDLRFCFGATMAVRRTVLEDIGGFPALAPYLADDYMLGKLVSDRGLEVRLAPYVVEDLVAEPGPGSLVKHELRWARTVRTVRPVGYAMSFVTDTLPLSLLVLFTSHVAATGFGVVGLALLMRALLHAVVHRRLEIRGPIRLWLVPARDMLSFAIRVASFFGRDVEWRRRRYFVYPSGRMLAKGVEE